MGVSSVFFICMYLYQYQQKDVDRSRKMEGLIIISMLDGVVYLEVLL